MRSAPTRRAAALAAAAVAAALALTACGARTADEGASSTPSDAGSSAAVTPDPGITDTTLTFGITTPLTGTTAGPGNCTADGATAYFDMKNDAGGITFGDGKTRTVEIKKYDDAYDPAKSATNFQQMVSDGVFAAGVGLGTPTNRAWHDAAVQAGIPQVLVMTGDPYFSTRSDSPLGIGLVPTYMQEGGAFGEALVADGQAHKVAVLYQNDDYGKGYYQGFKDAIAGSSNIEVVKELTYEPTDQSLEGQITELAATGADVLFHAVSVTPLAIADLQKAQSLGWKPVWFLPSNTASPGGVLTPGNVVAADGSVVYPGVYSVGFAQSAAAPTFGDSAEGKAYNDAIAKYTTNQDGKSFPHCVWSWEAAQILEQAFEKMTEPTRASFYEALTSISGFTPDFAFGPVDLTQDGTPAMNVVSVQKFNGKGYANVDAVG